MFRFKQFTINQDQCAMKVGTDGVLLGAWAELPSVGQVLDIGTGTGLLALMLAQRNANIQVDALEIDALAAQQAKSNVAASPWSDRVEVRPVSVQAFFEKEKEKQYDLIISNPPFYQSGALIQSHARRQARHNDSLSFSELMRLSAQHLFPQGLFCLIVPFESYAEIMNLAEENALFLRRINRIYPNNKRFEMNQPKRVLLAFSPQKTSLEEESLIIEPEERHHYSEAYKHLTQDFYWSFRY